MGQTLTVAECQTNLAQLEAAKITLQQDLERISGLIDTMRGADAKLAVQAVLSGNQVDGGQAAKIAEFEVQARTIQVAIGNIGMQIGEAKRLVDLAQIEEWRENAANLRCKADLHQQRADELRAELEAWEGCKFAPIVKMRDPMLGTDVEHAYWEGTRSAQMRQEAAKSEVLAHKLALKVDGKKI